MLVWLLIRGIHLERENQAYKNKAEINFPYEAYKYRD